jgi:hypothetical protein
VVQTRSGDLDLKNLRCMGDDKIADPLGQFRLSLRHGVLSLKGTQQGSAFGI